MRPLAIDDDNRYTGLDRFGRVDDQWYLNTSTSATLDRLQYGYDRDSDVLYQNNLVNAAFSELYHANSTTTGDNNSAYDPLNRLTNFRRGTLTSSGNNGTGLDTITTANLNSTTGVPNQNSWSLDALGNWTSGAGVSNTFNSQNEETTNGSSSLAYDHNGNMTTDQAGNLYTFDAWNNLIRIANSSNSTLEVFQYDAQGRAVVNNNGSGVESRYYDGTNIIQEQFGTTYIQFVRGLAYVNEVILRDRNADGNGSTGNLGITGSGMEEREYEQHDTQFSAISLTDSTGAVIQRYVYDPYGTSTSLNASWAAAGTGTNYWLYTFQGMRIVDAPGISGMLFSQTRIYDATLGRWTAPDTPFATLLPSSLRSFLSNPRPHEIAVVVNSAFVDGLNVFQAFRDAPVHHLDPSGHWSWSGALGGALGGFGYAVVGIVVGTALAFTAPVSIPVLLIAGGVAGLAGGIYGGLHSTTAQEGFDGPGRSAGVIMAGTVCTLNYLNGGNLGSPSSNMPSGPTAPFRLNPPPEPPSGISPPAPYGPPPPSEILPPPPPDYHPPVNPN